jgi:hypothetical protein
VWFSLFVFGFFSFSFCSVSSLLFSILSLHLLRQNKKRKAVIRTQRWRLRIKLQKDNTDKQSTAPEESPYNSSSKYDREKKEQPSVLQLVSQPNKSRECKDVVL